ncbi:MAG TPA: DUF3592 domain-containing protein [Enhygromyxa sp.]|nr:DUF3592 domain-containing protein [Enhygromyxa sp.]
MSKPQAILWSWLLGVACFGGGAYFSYDRFVGPLQATRAAERWVETECTIVEARTLKHESDDGTSYELELRYRYPVDGREHEGARYGFYDGYFRRQRTVDGVVAALREAGTVPCYRDPESPDRVVIDRSYDPVSTVGSLGLLGILFGIVLVMPTLRPRRRAEPRIRRWREPDTAAGRWVLERQREGHGIAALLCLVLAISVGGAALALFWLAAETTWIYVPAVAVAVIPLACLAMAIHQLLAAMGPPVVLEVDRPSAPLGGSITAHWSVRGIAPVREVVFELLGQEHREVGFDPEQPLPTHQTFYEEAIARVQTSARSGVVELAIPAGTMHSFTSEHHRIEWSVRMTVVLDWWPDELSTFTVVVGPEVRS